MATQTGYFGQAIVNNWGLWYNAGSGGNVNLVTKIKKNASATYTSAFATGPSDGQVLTLDSDEYPTGITFHGQYVVQNMHSDPRNANFMLCDANRNHIHYLFYTDGWGYQLDGDQKVAASICNKSNQSWTDLAGATLGFSRSGLNGNEISAIFHQQVDITTAYLSRTITVNVSGPGTATISANSLTRNQTANLTLTPTSGYIVSNVVASAGTLTRTSPVAYTFTMPQPAQNITITVTFSQIMYTAVPGEIIYAEWYNQE